MSKPIWPVITTDRVLDGPEFKDIEPVVERMKEMGYTFVETALEVRVYRPNGDLAILAKRTHGTH